MKAIIVILVGIMLLLGAVAWLGYSTIEETQRQYGQDQHTTSSNKKNYPPFKTMAQ